ncbi:hypothetical protein CK203_080667 [Vitis vinifera]|uniref:Uncharacterized protein n=1 Tax=Vitis vinifera TaxID=29760 RepID=A0A438EZH6_VITVI|nr:hypothetical protein CK203_080667 [Vitis vinifera]
MWETPLRNSFLELYSTTTSKMLRLLTFEMMVAGVPSLQGSCMIGNKRRYNLLCGLFAHPISLETDDVMVWLPTKNGTF